MLYLSGQEGSGCVAHCKTFQKPSDGKHCIKAKRYARGKKKKTNKKTPPKKKKTCTLSKTHKTSHHPSNHKFLVGWVFMFIES